MKTPVTEILQVEYPIFAFSHCRDVVAAVTTAGRLRCAGRGRAHAGSARGRPGLDRRAGPRPALRGRPADAEEVRRGRQRRNGPGLAARHDPPRTPGLPG